MPTKKGKKKTTKKTTKAASKKTKKAKKVTKKKTASNKKSKAKKTTKKVEKKKKTQPAKKAKTAKKTKVAKTTKAPVSLKKKTTKAKKSSPVKVEAKEKKSQSKKASGKKVSNKKKTKKITQKNEVKSDTAELNLNLAEKRSFKANTKGTMQTALDSGNGQSVQAKNSPKSKITSRVDKEIKHGIVEEVVSLSEDYKLADIFDAVRKLEFFTDFDSDECQEKHCDNLATTLGHCRLHYIKNWHTLQTKMAILKEGKLQDYIEELVNKYSAKQIDIILSDLIDDKEFFRVLNELNIDTSFDESFSDDDDDVGDDTKLYIQGRENMDD